MDKIFILDAGHGGMINKEYQTAPKKMYDHGAGMIAYEGVINRQVKKRVMLRAEAYGYRVIDITNTQMDLPLAVRVDMANRICDAYGKENCVYISLHSNAGKGEGFEIWTSVGQTKSDYYASLFAQIFMDTFPNIKVRKDTSDDDIDKESNFYVLKWTHCPAILPEWLFFDNINDFHFMKDVENQGKYADMICEFMKQVLIKKI